MSGYQFLWTVIRSLLWPPKGIILFEEQVIQWCVAIGHAWIKANGYVFLIIAAIYFAIALVVFERMPHMHGHHGIGRVLHFIFSMLVVVLLAWFWLIYGAVRGRRADQEEANRGEREATDTYTYRRHITRSLSVTNTFTRLSLHFRLGRWLYRMFFNLLGRISVFRNNYRLHEFFARFLALVVILWGVWKIPYVITH